VGADAVIKFFAKGGEGEPEHKRAHRLVNAWEFAKLAKQAADFGRYVIAVKIPNTKFVYLTLVTET
jgi:hypothetical protein